MGEFRQNTDIFFSPQVGSTIHPHQNVAHNDWEQTAISLMKEETMANNMRHLLTKELSEHYLIGRRGSVVSA